MNNMKRIKIEAVKGWINALTAVDAYNQHLLSGYNGDELDKMTLKEIDMLLNFIKATYHHAHINGVKVGKEAGEFKGMDALQIHNAKRALAGLEIGE